MQGDNAINMERLNHGARPDPAGASTSSKDCTFPDLLAVASFYPEWTKIGGGLGNYMVYGDMPQNGIADPSQVPLPARHDPNKNLSEVLPVDPADAGQVQEEIAHSWYKYPERQGRRCIPGTASPSRNTPGPKPPYKQLDENGKYSWLKAPRWKGNAMEVGPLARMLVGYASGTAGVQGSGDRGAGPAEACRPTALFSTLGRTAARGLETRSRCTG